MSSASVIVMEAFPLDGQAAVLSSQRCATCGTSAKKGDVIIRTMTLDPFTCTFVHRRCMEKLLAVGPEDAAIAESKFEAYRQQVADKHGLDLLHGVR